MEELNKLIIKMDALKLQEAEASIAKKLISDELELQEKTILDILVRENMTAYKGPAGTGTVIVSSRTSVKTPKTPEEKELFFSWLKQEGLFDNMISVNSMTLNKLYKELFQKAQEAEDIDFIDRGIPGIGKPVVTPAISYRKG
jgi:hypothetical protein